MAIPISGPTTITEPGEYELVNDINGTIEIASNDVTLNGNGYTVIASSASEPAIKAYSISNLEVYNVRCINSKHGIYVSTSSDISIRDSIVQGNSRFGIYIYYSDNIDMSNITANNNGLSENGVGIMVQVTDSCKIDSVFANANYGGIYVSESPNTIITNVTSSENETGITFFLTKNTCLVSDCILNNNIRGIEILYSNYITIKNTTTSYNGYGIEMVSSSYCVIDNLIANENTEAGIDIWWNSTDNTIKSSTFINNSSGILFGYNPGNTLIYNNYFSNNVNVSFYNTNNSYTWNIEKTPGKNIVGGPYIGGNYWGSPDGTGFSDLAEDSDGDGIADEPYIIDSQNIDYYPLVKVPEVIEITLPQIRLAPPSLPPLPKEERVIVEKQVEIRRVPVIPEELFIYGAVSAGMIPLILALLKRK